MFGFEGFGGFPGFGGMHGMQQRRREPTGPKTFNLYKVLGLTKGECTEKEIRKASKMGALKGNYRHPDRGGTKENFAKLQLAKEWLSNAKKKKTYDKYGDACTRPDFDQSLLMQEDHSDMKKGKPTRNAIKVTLEELYNSSTRKLKITRKVVIKDSDNSVGDPRGDVWEFCDECRGRGVVMETVRAGPGMLMQRQVHCASCEGNGHGLKRGFHMGRKSEILDVFIEKGSKDGDSVKFRGKGNMEAGCLPGDIIIQLKQVPHKIFERKGRDLLIKKVITLQEALCGFEFEITHLDGRKLLIKTEAGQIVKENSVQIVKEQGFPVKGDNYEVGDLFIAFAVKFPKDGTFNSQQRKQLRKIMSGGVITADDLKEDGTKEESKDVKDFRKRLEAWKGDKLSKYDSDSTFRASREKKYQNRQGFVSYLDNRIAQQMESQVGPCDPKSPTRQDSGYNDELKKEIHYLQHVDLKSYGQKKSEFKGDNAHDSDDEDDESRFRGHRAVNCAQM